MFSSFDFHLPKLDSFILPGSTRGAALLHVVRTVCRRAERRAWALIEADPDRTNPLAAKYLNRLSDLAFILSRLANPEGDVEVGARGRPVRPGVPAAEGRADNDLSYCGGRSVRRGQWRRAPRRRGLEPGQEADEGGLGNRDLGGRPHIGQHHPALGHREPLRSLAVGAGSAT